MFTGIVASCQTNFQEASTTAETTIEGEVISTAIIDTNSYDYSWKNQYDYKSALINNLELPNGYERLNSDKESFTSWLCHLPIKSNNTVYLYNGEEKYNQEAQYKVIDIDVGEKDLQQCADAVMRLRAEYLYSYGQFDKIHFKYTNGINIPFSKWGSGYYPSLKGNKVVWVSSSNNKSYKSFKKYMKNIFMYAGTLSLETEMKNVELSKIEAGDVLIKGGAPGHAIIVLDVALNKESNNKIFLVAQSYMPAQNIHILNNPTNPNLSPWYSLADIKDIIETPEWTFYSNQLKRFVE